MFPGHKPRVDWSPTPSRKKPRLPNSGDLSPNPPSPASLPGLSIDLLSEIEPDLDPIEDWDPQQAPSSTGPDPIEDWSPENEASSHACPPAASQHAWAGLRLLSLLGGARGGIGHSGFSALHKGRHLSRKFVPAAAQAGA